MHGSWKTAMIFFVGTVSSISRYCSPSLRVLCRAIMVYYSGARTVRWQLYGSSCYAFSSTGNDFVNVKSKCEGSGSYNRQLVKISNGYELSFCQEQLNQIDLSRSYYVGLQRNSSIAGNRFTWTDGSQPPSDWWESSYPSDVSKACAVLEYSSGKWLLEDTECTEIEYFICKRNAKAIQTWSRPQLLSRKTEMKKIDEENQCLVENDKVSSRIECSLRCMMSNCDVFGFQEDSCMLYVIKSAPCVSMVYQSTVDYYSTNNGYTYKCPVSTLSF